MSNSGALNTASPWLDPAYVEVVASSGIVANAAANAVLPAAVGKTTYITGFSCDALGSTAALGATIQITGIAGTLRFAFLFPAGAATLATPVRVTFSQPIPATGPNTAVTVALPPGGAGNTYAVCNAWGFQR